MTVRCFACALDTQTGSRGTAFIAGVIYALQWSNDAIPQHLCEAHGQFFVKVFPGLLERVPEEFRRKAAF